MVTSIPPISDELFDTWYFGEAAVAIRVIANKMMVVFIVLNL